jgi:hypothetical protein
MSLLTLPFLLITFQRITIDYSEQGAYFDETTSTTYYSQAIIFWAGSTSILLLLTAILIVQLRKVSRRS